MPTILELVTSARRRGENPATSDQIAAMPPISGGGTPYGLSALNAETTKVATAPEGTRNDTLNRAAYNLGQLVAARHLDGQTVTDALTSAATAAGLPTNEIESTLRSGGLAGAATPRQVDTWEPTVEPTTTVIEPSVTGGSVNDTGASVTSTDASLTHTDVPLEQSDSSEEQSPTAEEQEAAYQAWRAGQVATQAEQIRISDEARSIVTLERQQATWAFPPHTRTLTDELALPDDPVEYLIDDIFPVDANILLTAQYKTGKTTMVLNLIRSLADRTPFLDLHHTHLDGGRITYLNYEVSPGQMRRWLRAEGITSTDTVSLLNVRGHSLPILDGYPRQQLTDYLTALEARVIIVDPYARAFVGNGDSENDNMQAGRFLDAWDQIKEECGARELVMVTHTGRDQPGMARTTRARGATRVDDWADVRWLLTKDPDTDLRFLSATGRDVEWPEHQITFDPDTKRLTASDLDRYAARRNAIEDEVVRIINNNPGLTQNALFDALKDSGVGIKRNDFPALLESARGHLRIYSVPGPRDSKLWHPTIGGAA